MNTAEDLESLENLHALCSLMTTICGCSKVISRGVLTDKNYVSSDAQQSCDV